MKKVGLMTFHAAHNYGSVLQAFATQYTIEKLGYPCEIINYRLKNQREFYNKLYSYKFGKKFFVSRLLKLPEHRKARKRLQKFEAFITERLKLTSKEYTTYDALLSLRDQYDVLVSGSDQVWNENCTAEFRTEPPESILGYYLAFAGDKTRRIAISSSFGNMREEAIQKYKAYLSQYASLSCREQNGADMLSKLLGREVTNTLDPTFLLKRDEWLIKGVYDVKEEYIFVYTLARYRTAQKMLKDIHAFAQRQNMKVICVAPFCPVHVPGIKAFADCGPLDFLSYIRSAKLVITDSFHGTAFSVNFGVPFYNIQRGNDQRKAQLLNKLGLGHRILAESAELAKIEDFSCDFTAAWEKLNCERNATMQYLQNALEH